MGKKEENKGEEEQNSQKKITEDWTQKSISIEQNSDTKYHSAVSHVVDENNSENKSTPLKNAKKAANFEKIKENNNCNKENQAPVGKNLTQQKKKKTNNKINKTKNKAPTTTSIFDQKVIKTSESSQSIISNNNIALA